MTDRISLTGIPFEHGASFDAGDARGGLHLGKLEAQYEELFAEVLEDGVITEEERQRLDRAADNLGLDKNRLKQLEAALQAAYEAHHHVKVVVQGVTPTIAYVDDEPGRASLTPLAPVAPAPGQPADATVTALQRRVAQLEARVRQLEVELEQARNDVAVEVDLHGVTAPIHEDDPADLQRRVRQDPTDPEPMHSLYRIFGSSQPDPDKQWLVASALSFLGKANAEEKAHFERHRPKPGTLPKPTAAISEEGWRRLLLHPEEELLSCDIFAVITSPVLLGRVSALRRDKLLPKLDPAKKQDPVTSTVSAVRALAWSAAILGLKPPPIFIDPELPVAVEMVPGMPPNVRIGSKLLSGRTPLEVAFECGRSLACFREEHFVRWLLPGVPDLEDLFLAALTIGNPALPLPPHAKTRVAPIAGAIQPVLEPAAIDRLRGYFLRFVEEGGRTNLQRWAHAVDKTACRAGFVLCNDLPTVGSVLSKEERGEGGGPGERMRDVLAFVCSDRCFQLRKQIGVAIAN